MWPGRGGGWGSLPVVVRCHVQAPRPPRPSTSPSLGSFFLLPGGKKEPPEGKIFGNERGKRLPKRKFFIGRFIRAGHKTMLFALTLAVTTSMTDGLVFVDRNPFNAAVVVNATENFERLPAGNVTEFPHTVFDSTTDVFGHTEVVNVCATYHSGGDFRLWGPTPC